ncbi:MAG: hypothetical protein JRE19_19355 [Deltaproteobacteria bacterium]|nr:hypothetical protein [Deltaproteobacteria bacterium]
MKNPPIHDYLLEQLIKVYQGSLNPELTDFRIPSAVYTDESRFQAERLAVPSGASSVACSPDRHRARFSTPSGGLVSGPRCLRRAHHGDSGP